MKSQRQRSIIQLIKQSSVTSQMQLVKLLRSAGFAATQATVSRDLDDLGAIKVRKDGKIAYTMPNDSAGSPGSEALRSALVSYALNIEATSNLVVVKTPPGHAGVVASAIDRGEVEGVAGSIAGDDTVFIACKQGVFANRVASRLSTMATPKLNSKGAS